MSKKKPKDKSAVKWSLSHTEEGFRRQRIAHELKKNKLKHKKKILENLEEE
jgi:hypothetical protein